MALLPSFPPKKTNAIGVLKIAAKNRLRALKTHAKS
jgi:hypothetical protein